MALENRLPVIIMKGSGMAADLVSERLEKYFTISIHIKCSGCYVTSRPPDFNNLSVNEHYGPAPLATSIHSGGGGGGLWS